MLIIITIFANVLELFLRLGQIGKKEIGTLNNINPPPINNTSINHRTFINNRHPLPNHNNASRRIVRPAMVKVTAEPVMVKDGTLKWV